MNKTQETFEYHGEIYPDYIRRGNAVENVTPIAQKFCQGVGLDIGGTPEWHLPGATIVNPEYTKYDATNLPDGKFDYIFSSHCLEHLDNYIEALELWAYCVKPGGQLFLYLPHKDMDYWKPQHCRKHLHQFDEVTMYEIFRDLKFQDIFFSGRDLYWSFAITAVVP